ncbi:MAG: MoxR family ATPase [Puniceicoccales bacterium]|jgi:MoxR-like ATPase|nr:MoxR family ATPase [Puniceicoccales bacterium]
MSDNLSALGQEIRESSAWVTLLRDEMSRVIVGQRYMIDRLIVGLLSNGHVLLEGVPGLAKTLSVRTLAAAIQASFKRIQFTPDLLPADIVGTLIYNPREASFETKKGPIFANVVLADEINRAPAKVQSALLEAMQEQQVTIGDKTFRLPEPFLVLATENPVDQEGTYPLPEAQVDRFMMKLRIEYPDIHEEKRILQLMSRTEPLPEIHPVVSPESILESRKVLDRIYIDEKVVDYIVNIVFATRKPSDYKININHLIQFGASPRATIALTLAAKAWAFLQGRAYVIPQDVKTIGIDVLRHRILLSYEAEAESITAETIISRILNTVPVP